MGSAARVASGLRARVRRPRRRTMLAAGALLLVAAFLLGGLAQVRLETSMDSFLPARDEAVRDLQEVGAAFGGEPVVVLLEGDEPGRLLGEGNAGPLMGLEGELAQLPDVAVTYGPATLLNQVAGRMQDLLAELSGRRDSLAEHAEQQALEDGASQEEAARAGQRAVEEFSARYGGLVVDAMPAGLPTLNNPDFAHRVVFDDAGEPREQWRFVVPTPESVAILVRPRAGLDEAATQRLVQRVRGAVDDAGVDAAEVTVSGVPAVASALGTQVRSEIPLLGGVAVLLVTGCFLLVPWTSWRYRALPVASALLAIGLTLAAFGWAQRPLSLGVLAFLTVLLGTAAYYPTYLAQRVSARTVAAVVAATSASFATLLLSPLPFVRDLGLMLSVGVLVSAATGLVLLRVARAGAREPATDGASAPAGPAPPARRSPSVPARAGALAGAIAVAAAGWLALPGMELDSSMERFAEGLPALDDADTVASVLGSRGEVAVTLTGDEVRTPETLDWSRQAQNALLAAHGDRLTPVVTPPMVLPFLGADPTGEEVSAALRLLPPYLTGAVFRGDGGMALLSFGVDTLDAGELRVLRDELTGLVPDPPEGYETAVTGLPVAIARAHELLSDNRLWSNLAGIAAASLVVAIALRRRADALRAALAAGIATGAGLLAQQLAGIALSPLTVALGALTAAVGCEFAVLLSEASRRGDPALRRSVLLATATSMAGYAVLALSDLAAIAEFGLVLAGAVALSLAAAACVTWACPPRETPSAPRHTAVATETVGAST
ncbi:RND transporter [Haloechinothrix sp. YIM 98757]|uniref:RND transporter n=1 Tax=Haloechinothrix aidingensis TaxID=2752311 RepID=A0A838ABB2_9PSEU|nr:RND transporter [Haloechinothrix aidingensis]MBA0126495.1 RND transporter [Haloechinothrix aidingensis]